MQFHRALAGIGAVGFGADIAKGLRLSTDDIIRRYVIMQIVCNLGVDTRAVEKKFNMVFNDYFNDALAQLQQLQKDGLIVFNETRLRVTSTGRLLLRNICMAFDRYLPHAASTSYSRSL